MLSSKKYIFLFLVVLMCAVNIMAQQTLPVNNQSKKTSSDDDDMTTILKQKMFVKVTTNTNKVFVGEPIMATYKFYVAMHLNDEPSVTKQPEFTGCSVKELNFEQGPEFENINNETYAVYTIRKVQLTPLSQGQLSMGKASVNNFIQIDNPSDPFVTKKYNILISNDDDEIQVADLPEKNKPSDFYGITGTFGIAADVADKKIPVGENGHLIITIKGAGNLEAINKPQVSWPSTIDHFDGTDSQHIDQDNFPISGDRVFDIPFIGKKEGTIVIPPVQFSFFNTTLKDYQTLSTNSISIVFTKALARKDEFKDIVNHEVGNRQYLWIVPAIAIVVSIIGFISFKRNKAKAQAVPADVSVTPAPVYEQPQPVYRIRFRTDFSHYLSDLENIKENKPFFAKSKNLLTKAVAERIDSNENSEQILAAQLREKTYNSPVCNKVDALYEAINLNLYAPFETDADLGFYLNELKQVIQELQA